MIRLYLDNQVEDKIAEEDIDTTIWPDGEFTHSEHRGAEGSSQNIVLVQRAGELTPEQIEIIRLLKEDSAVVVMFAKT